MLFPIILLWYKRNFAMRISINAKDGDFLERKDDDCGGRMISVGRLLLSAGERGRSHREDTTIPTQWRGGGRIPREGYQHNGERERAPREGYQHSGWTEEGYQDTNTVDTQGALW